MILRLGFSAFVVAVTALAIAGVINVAVAQFIAVGGAVLSLTALVVNVTSRRRLLRSVDAIKSSVPIVVSEPILTPRDDIAALMATVRVLGYDLIGATDTTVTGAPIRTWIMTRPEGDIWVEIGFAGRPVAIFLSQAPSGRFVETAYPTGADIDVPQLLAGPIGTSPGDALGTQRERLASLGGPSRRVVTMADYLAVEVDQRASNGGMRIRQHLDRVIGPSIRDYAISLVIETVALGALLVAGPAG